MSQVIRPVKKKPGLFVIPALGDRVIDISELREDSLYDTVEFAAQAQSAGTKEKFFDNVSGKGLHHTNLERVHQIPAHHELAVIRVGLAAVQAMGNTVPSGSDVLKLAWNTSLEMKANKRTIAEGPSVKFQSGIGVTGQTNENNSSILTIGTAAAAAAPVLIVPQAINADDQVSSEIEWESNFHSGGQATTDNLTGAFLDVHGIFKLPATA